MDRPWFAHYPEGVPREIDLSQYTSLTALIEEAFVKYRERNAYVGFGKTTSYAEIDRMSTAIAGWLQSKGLRSTPAARSAAVLAKSSTAKAKRPS